MQTTLTNNDLRHLTPSVFAASPWQRMSERYRFVPTIDVVDMLREQGFSPVRAQQSRSRIEGKGAFTKHMIRFRHADYLQPTQVGEELPELVLVNSHDGTAAYRLFAGIFRLVCSNGLIIASANFGSFSVRHSGGDDFRSRIIDATYQIVEETPKAFRQVEEWKQIELTRPKQIAFANAASELKPNAAINPAHLLTARRDEDATNSDASRDLWRTTNVIQESLIRGGIQGRSGTGRRIKTRPIKAVDSDIKINRALWRLAEEMAKLA